MSYFTGTSRNKYPYHLYLLCLVCNVQLTVVIRDFTSNKWVALTRACLCVVCV